MVITKMSVAKKVESELRKLPLRVIELTGRGRNRTGPRPQWPPKRVRHHPWTPQQRRKPQASPPVNETSVSAVRAQRKVVPPQSLPTLDANTLQQLQDERHAMRTAFDDFATTLQQPAKTRVRCRPRRYVVSPAGTTSDPQEETASVLTRTAADRRFCQRSACRGKARGST